MTAIAQQAPIRSRPWFPFAQLGWVAAAAALWYLIPGLGAWPLLIAMLPWLIRLVRTGRSGRRTFFDIPLLMFLVTAGVSLWAAYDPDGSRAVFEIPVGMRKFWGLMLSVLVFYAVAEFETETQRWWLLTLLSGFGTAVALWFIATHDWQAAPALWDPITRLGRGLQAPLPYVPGHRLSPNVAGGLVALLLPTGFELLTSYPRRRMQAAGSSRPPTRRPWLASIAWAFVPVSLVGLVLSSSRGAWLGVAGALSLAAVWWLAGEASGRFSGIAIFVASLLAACLLATLAVVAVPFLRSTILGSQALDNRLDIAYQAGHLIRDYLFTGCGLGNFPLVHSTYALLIHVPEMVFAHSTPLDVAVEQGMLASMALAAIWVGGAWMGMQRLAETDRAPVGLRTGLLSLVVLVLHGAFDSTIYGSRALLLFWMPIGLIVAASRHRPAAASARGNGATEPSGDALALRSLDRAAWFAIGAAGLVIALLLALSWRPLVASWHANLGAVHQTLVELRAYDYRRFHDPTLDEIRRREDLSAAIRHFRRALALDPGQVTARTRLSQIALARRDYDAALEHARAAWEAGYRDRITRLVLGDALVAEGQVDEAARVVQGLERAKSRLQGQATAQYQQQGDWQRAAYAWRTVLALDPGDERARSGAERAAERARDE